MLANHLQTLIKAFCNAKKNCYHLTTTPNHEFDPGLIPSPLKGTHVGHLHNDPYFLPNLGR